MFSMPPRRLFLILLASGLWASQEMQAQAVSLSSAEDSVAQAVKPCFAEAYPLPYAEVITDKDPLTVRNKPNGKAIGSIPKGWKVTVLQWTRNGFWAFVSGPYGYGPTQGFVSAEKFREGWVSARFLKDLGRSCDKPGAAVSLVLPATQPFPHQASTVPASTVPASTVHPSDWVALGDWLTLE